MQLVGRGASRRSLALNEVRPWRSTREVTPPLYRFAVGWQVGQGPGLRGGQARAQPVSVRVRPRLMRRRRFSAATRWCSQWSFLVVPR